jgi:hypothetical protein
MRTTNQPCFQTPRLAWCPPEMLRAPEFGPALPASPVDARYALLINPFYPGRGGQFRKARAYTFSCADELRCHDASTLESSLLGRKLAGRATAFSPDTGGGRNSIGKTLRRVAHWLHGTVF